MKTMTTFSKKARRGAGGFTLLELLIAVIIIGILVAIIVPVLTSRANQARHTAALKDLESIASAEEHVAIDTGYFVRLYALDDVRGGNGVANNTYNGAVPDNLDGFKDEAIHANAGNPLNLFIDSGNNVPSDGQILSAAIYQRAILNETNFNWNGPYLNVTKKAGGLAPANQTPPWVVYNPEIVAYGVPIDPWGSPYQFFNRQGRLDETPRVGAFEQTPQTLVFDRPTILTMGPNGLPGDGTGGAVYGSGDDIFKQF